jgi:hypothetical protein
MKRNLHGWVAAVIGLALVTGVAAQDDKPSGTVEMESTSVALGIGVSWGDGTLTYEGNPHKFTLSGLSVIDLGISKVTAKGEVFNLKKLEDFSGNYVAAEAAGALGGGAGVVAMRNQNAVVMKLTSTSTGVQLTLAGKGVDVKLK